MKMVSPSVVFLSLLLLFSSSFNSVSSSAMDDACRYLGDSYFTPEACAAILSTDPRSKTAPDVQTIASISIDIATASAAAVVDHVKKVGANATDDYGKLRAEAALVIMENTVASFKWASGAMAANFKGAAEAMMFLGRYAIQSVESAVALGDLVVGYVDTVSLADAIIAHM